MSLTPLGSLDKIRVSCHRIQGMYRVDSSWALSRVLWTGHRTPYLRNERWGFVVWAWDYKGLPTIQTGNFVYCTEICGSSEPSASKGRPSPAAGNQPAVSCLAMISCFDYLPFQGSSSTPDPARPAAKVCAFHEPIGGKKHGWMQPGHRRLGELVWTEKD